MELSVYKKGFGCKDTVSIYINNCTPVLTAVIQGDVWEHHIFKRERHVDSASYITIDRWPRSMKLTGYYNCILHMVCFHKPSGPHILRETVVTPEGDLISLWEVIYNGRVKLRTHKKEVIHPADLWHMSTPASLIDSEGKTSEKLWFISGSPEENISCSAVKFLDVSEQFQEDTTGISWIELGRVQVRGWSSVKSLTVLQSDR